MPDSRSIHARLVHALTNAGVAFDVSHHEPVYTSAEAAAVRGVSLHSGAKALIVKGGDGFAMIVLPADLSLDGKAAKKQLGGKSLRFATKEEVFDLTGLKPGSIPPFGSLFGLPTYCDDRLADNAQINFNAADHAISISMTYDDYIRYEKPAMGRFAKGVQ